MKTRLPSNFLLCAISAFFALSFQNLETTGLANEAAPWELLGSRKVNYALDRDEIPVTSAQGVFKTLQVKVKRSPLNMHKLVVHFGNGDKQELELRENLKAGGQSRLIDLPGNSRVIKKVVFWYDTKNLAGRKAMVELWGK